MSVSLYFDHHVPKAIAKQLRLRGVDVLTSADDHRDRKPDHELLARAHELRRLIVTQDKGFKGLAELWQREGRTFSGVAFSSQTRAPIGRLVHDLELIAKATDPDDWTNVVQHLPL